jgi:hypothetical protein
MSLKMWHLTGCVDFTWRKLRGDSPTLPFSACTVATQSISGQRKSHMESQHVFDLSGSTLSKMQDRLGDFWRIFWWSETTWGTKTPEGDPSAFVKLEVIS